MENLLGFDDDSYENLSQEEKDTLYKNYLEKNNKNKLLEKLEKRGEIKKKKELEVNLRKECKSEYNSRSKKYSLDGGLNLNESDCLKLKNAAALCQLTYACDPNRAGDNIYETGSRHWFPYIPSDCYVISEKMLNNFFSGLKNDKLFNNITKKEYSFAEKLGFGIFKHRIDLLEEFDRRISRKRTGFFSMLYYRKNGKKLDLAYVTSGTTANSRELYDLILDVFIVDILQAITGLSPQHTLSIQNAKLLDTFCNANKEYIGELYFFGHSLGGGMAVANSLATGREAVVFNNAGLSIIRDIAHLRTLVKNLNIPGNLVKYLHIPFVENNKITAYYTDRDMLSTEIIKNKTKHIGLKLLDKILTPQIIGKRTYLGKGGHGIEGICSHSLCLKLITNKNQIEGIGF